MIEEVIQTILILGGSILVSCILWLTAKKIVRRLSPLSKNGQSIIVSIIHGPIVISIIGYGALHGLESLHRLFPLSMPVVFSVTNITLIIQIVILASALRVSSTAIRNLIRLFTEERIVSKILVYCVYIIGFIALIYLVFSSPLTPNIAGNVWAGINFVTGLFITYIIVYILDIIISRYVKTFVDREPRLKTSYMFLRRLALASVAIIGISAVTFSIFPGAGGLVASLFVAAGFTSIVIGLAAQSSLSNLIAGMLVSVSQPFKIGEAVVFRKEFCFIEDIKLIHTILRTWDNRRLMVPNSLFQSEVVINYSSDDPTMLAPVFIQISYESDIDKAMSVMKEVALNHPECLPMTSTFGAIPNVVIMEYADSGINLRLLSRAKDQPTAFMMTRDLLYGIKKEFDANGIEIPYPRRQLVLDKESEKALKSIMGNSKNKLKSVNNEKGI